MGNSSQDLSVRGNLRGESPISKSRGYLDLGGVGKCAVIPSKVATALWQSLHLPMPINQLFYDPLWQVGKIYIFVEAYSSWIVITDYDPEAFLRGEGGRSNIWEPSHRTKKLSGAARMSCVPMSEQACAITGPESDKFSP